MKDAKYLMKECMKAGKCIQAINDNTKDAKILKAINELEKKHFILYKAINKLILKNQ